MKKTFGTKDKEYVYDKREINKSLKFALKRMKSETRNQQLPS